MKILAFGGSTSSTSINKELATYAASLFSGAEVKVLDLKHYELPIFSVDLEAKMEKPKAAIEFLNEIKNADFLVVSLAEHNGAYSAAFKNLLDWSSRIEDKVFQNKPMLLMATSPGKRGGASVLEIARNRFPFLGAQIKETFSLPEFQKNYQVGKGIVDSEIQSKLIQIIKTIF